jgi:hypothetical protein
VSELRGRELHRESIKIRSDIALDTGVDTTFSIVEEGGGSNRNMVDMGYRKDSRFFYIYTKRGLSWFSKNPLSPKKGTFYSLFRELTITHIFKSLKRTYCHVLQVNDNNEVIPLLRCTPTIHYKTHPTINPYHPFNLNSDKTKLKFNYRDRDQSLTVLP